MTDQPHNHRGRRWWQFGLRGLLLLVLLIALGLLACREYLKPYWRQQQTVALVERLGGTCHTAEAGQWWLRLLGSKHNVTQVNLADCNDPDAYVAQVAELPAIDLLIVGGPAFADEHARRLHKLRTLRGLILDCTSVSEQALAALREALSETEVYVSERRAIAALRQRFDMRSGPSTTALHLRQFLGDEWFQVATVADLREAPFDDNDAALLGMLHQLSYLSLDDTQVTDAGLRNLKGLKNLTDLYLAYTRISDVGLTHLSNLGHLSAISLEGTKITDAGLEHLKAMSQLEYLDLGRTRVTDAGIAKLKQVLPNCVILGPTWARPPVLGELPLTRGHPHTGK